MKQIKVPVVWVGETNGQAIAESEQPRISKATLSVFGKSSAFGMLPDYNSDVAIGHHRY